MNSWKEKLTIILLGYLVAFGPISIDMYLPSLPNIADDLNSTTSKIQTTITIFLLGMSIGILIFGPISDFLGRKKLLLIGIFLYFISSFGCAVANTDESLIIYRLFQSLGGAAASVLARALVRDMFDLNKSAGILSYMHIISMIIMILSPVLGSYIMLALNWRWIFYFLAIFSLIGFISTLFLLPKENLPREKISVKSYIQNYFFCLKTPSFISYLLVNGLSFGGMFAFISTSSFIYIEYFNTTENTYAYVFSSNILAIIFATYINSKLNISYSSNTSLRLFILVSSLATLFMSILYITNYYPIGLFISATMIYVSVTGAIGANILAILFNKIPDKAGSCSGLLISTQFMIGSLASFFASVFFDKTPKSLLLIMIICGASCLLIFIKIHVQEKGKL